MNRPTSYRRARPFFHGTLAAYLDNYADPDDPADLARAERDWRAMHDDDSTPATPEKAAQHMTIKKGPGEMRRAAADITVRSIDTTARSVRVVASTASVDSYGEIVEQSWDLSRYQKNPVVLYAHNATGGWLSGASSPADTLPIGRASDVAVVGGQLEATIAFASAKVSPLAEQVFQAFREDMVRAVSVGFKPGEIRQELRNGKNVDVLAQNELFEISVVPIPANADAVVERSAEGLRRAFEQTREIAQRASASDDLAACALAEAGLELDGAERRDLETLRAHAARYEAGPAPADGSADLVAHVLGFEVQR